MRLLAAMLLLLTCTTAAGQPEGASAAAERGRWMGAMGESGLRRFYATGAELGELVNRQVSYQVASRVGSLREQQSLGTSVASSELKSDVNAHVIQNDSLVSVGTYRDRPVFLRGLARVARRDEPGKVLSRSDRIDLGVLYAPTYRSYLGLGLALEQTTADIEFVDGRTTGFAAGPRLDAGLVLNDTWAVALRAERLHFDGDNDISIPTGSGRLAIHRDLESSRSFLKLEAISRYTRAQLSFLPPGAQLRWTTGLHYLRTEHERQINSLGLAVVEPFGGSERLGILRTGAIVSYDLSSSLGDNWNAFAEVLYDYEFDTNLNAPLDDRNTAILRVGLTRLLAPGQRVQVEYHRYQSWNGARERNNLSLVAVIDF